MNPLHVLQQDLLAAGGHKVFVRNALSGVFKGFNLVVCFARPLGCAGGLPDSRALLLES
jgi:hypothetical protein